MALTDNCDLFTAVHEDGVNRVIHHIMRQRPSLFNYATVDVAQNREVWCQPIEFTGDVVKYGNSLFTILNPIPVLGADSPPVGVGFCAQLSKLKIDFHKGNSIVLPAELNPPLKAQRFAIQFRLCGAIACPSPKEIDGIPVLPQDPAIKEREGRNLPPIVLRGQFNCFCLDVFAIGHVERQVIGGRESLIGKLDDMDIVDIKPDRLEDTIICYIKTTVNVILREKLTIAIETLMLSFPLFGLATVSLFPTPNPPIPNNPAVEEDELKAFVSMNVI
jgi:hypothetical protein